MSESESAHAPRQRLKPEIRRKAIVDLAFDAVADGGLEGLRTRDVATLAGINSATLHHHFPTKEDLIGAVAAELNARFRSRHANDSDDGAKQSAAAALAGQFADIVFYVEKQPALLAVYRELTTRAPRDRATAKLVAGLDEGLRTSLCEICRRGRRDGSLRSDLNPEAAADLVLSVIRGVVMSAEKSVPAIKRSLRELKRWLTAG